MDRSHHRVACLAGEIVEGAVVNKQIELTFGLTQRRRREIAMNEARATRRGTSPIERPDGLPDRNWREVDADDVETVVGEIDRVRARAAAEIDRAARSEASGLDELDELRPSAALPRRADAVHRVVEEMGCEQGSQTVAQLLMGRARIASSGSWATE